MGDVPNKKEDTTTFTVEADTTSSDVPSVTKLLNRKSLTLKKSKPSPPPLPPQSIPTPPPLKSTPSAPQSPSLSVSVAPNPPLTASPAPNLGMPLLSQEEQDAPTQLFQPSAQESSTVAPSPAPTLELAPSQSQPHEITISFEDSASGFQLETSSPTPSPSSSPTPPSKLNTDPAPILEIAPEVQAEIIQAASSPALVQPRTPPKIQRAARKSERGIQKLILWELGSLKNGTDPLARGISLLFQKGAQQALFLGITAPPAGSPVPHFISTAAVLPQDKLAIWTGLKWDPKVVPEMWNFFIKSGQVELSPPGSHTNLNSHRNVVRAAFGIQPSEWLLIIRVGPPTACRGVIALVSQKSLLTELNDALPLLSSPIPDAVA